MPSKIQIINDTWEEIHTTYHDGTWALESDLPIDEIRMDLNIVGCFLSNTIESNGHVTGTINCIDK